VGKPQSPKWVRIKDFYLSYNNICVKSEKSSVDKPQDRFCIFPQKRDTDFSVSPFYPIPNELAQ